MSPRLRRRFAQRVTFDTFDVLIGPELAGRFANEAEWQLLVDAMEAWYRVNGEKFEAEHLYPGARSWCWWRFHAREPKPPPSDEFRRLRQLGAISPDEEAEAMRQSTSNPGMT